MFILMYRYPKENFFFVKILNVVNWNILVTIEEIKRDSVSNDEWKWKIGLKKKFKMFKKLKNLKKFTL